MQSVPMKHVIRFVTVTGLAIAWASAATAQSLADVARKEEARRREVTKPSKVYTNESLAAADTTVPPASGSPAAPATSALQPAHEPAAASKEDTRRNQAYWRGRIAKAREGLERSRTFHEALQSRINALTTDFTARDDPAQRAVIGSNRQKALAELDRVARDIAGFEKQIRDIEEEARMAGVPPGWLR